MKSFISKKRLVDGLSKHGFTLNHEWEYVDFVFYRSAGTPEVFEMIRLKILGRDKDAVAAHAGISTVQSGNSFGGVLIETKCMLEMATIEGGCAEISSEEEAIAWEQKLTNIAPDFCRSMALKHAQNLLERTQMFRQVAKQYLEAWGGGNAEQIWRFLETRATREQMEWAKQRSLRFRHIHDADHAYAAAVLGINLFSTEIEGKTYVFNGIGEPGTEQSLVVLIELLVDRLLHPAAQLAVKK